MNKINIQINNAKIMSYEVQLGNDIPKVSATIGLFAGDKRISIFSLTTGSTYGSGMEFDLPARMIEPIVEISKQLEIILTQEANKSLKQLEEPKND